MLSIHCRNHRFLLSFAGYPCDHEGCIQTFDKFSILRKHVRSCHKGRGRKCHYKAKQSPSKVCNCIINPTKGFLSLFSKISRSKEKLKNQKLINENGKFIAMKIN